jgi:cell division protein FtsX
VRFIKIGLIGTAVILILSGLLYLWVWIADRENAKQYAPAHSTHAIGYVLPFAFGALALPLFWIGVILAWAFSTVKPPPDPEESEVRTPPTP